MRMGLRLSVKGSTSVNSSSCRAAVTTAMARVVPFPPWIFVLCFFLESGVVFAEGLKGTAFAGGFSFANFVHHPFRYLNATQVGSHLVHEAEACNFACVRDISCVSLNVAAHPDIHGHFLCELLSSDKYNSSDQFLPHPDFDHHSIHVSSEFFFLLFAFNGENPDQKIITVVSMGYMERCYAPTHKQLTNQGCRHEIWINILLISSVSADPLLREPLCERRFLHRFVPSRRFQMQLSSTF